MTPRCTDLDLFFDGELEPDYAAAFRDHLAACERCQRATLGRIHEFVAVARGAASGNASATEPSAAVYVVSPATSGNAVAAVVAARSPPATPAVIGRRRSGLVYLVPLVAAAAAMPLVLQHKRKDAAVAFTLDVEHQGRAVRSDMHVGDVLRSTVHGGHYRALWVYFGDRELVVACPDDDRCRQDRDGLTVDLTLAQPGRYIVIGLRSEGEILPPVRGNTFQELLAGQRAPFDYKLHLLDVD